MFYTQNEDCTNAVVYLCTKTLKNNHLNAQQYHTVIMKIQCTKWYHYYEVAYKLFHKNYATKNPFQVHFVYRSTFNIEFRNSMHLSQSLSNPNYQTMAKDSCQTEKKSSKLTFILNMTSVHVVLALYAK